MVHGFKLNVGKMVIAQLHSSITKKVHIYPHFVTVFLNNICGIIENAPNIKECFVLKKNTDPHNGMKLHYTEHMKNQMSNFGSSFTDDLVIFSLEDETRVDPTQANSHMIHFFK